MTAEYKNVVVECNSSLQTVQQTLNNNTDVYNYFLSRFCKVFG